MNRQAVMFALPGTSSEEGMETLRRIDERFAARFGGVMRTWAYTSSGVRRKLEQSSQHIADPAEALTGLWNEGVTHVAVKSLHLATGMEYNELRGFVDDRRTGMEVFDKVLLSTPLLDVPADLERTIRCLLASLPPETGPGEAVLLVTHGSRQPGAQVAYERALELCRRFERRVILGSLISKPGVDDVIRECKAGGIRKVVLVPLMIVAGFSARNEIAGNGPESWESALRREGIDCEPVLKGLADHDDVVALWLDDVERMLSELS